MEILSTIRGAAPHHHLKPVCAFLQRSKQNHNTIMMPNQIMSVYNYFFHLDLWFYFSFVLCSFCLCILMWKVDLWSHWDTVNNRLFVDAIIIHLINAVMQLTTIPFKTNAHRALLTLFCTELNEFLCTSIWIHGICVLLSIFLVLLLLKRACIKLYTTDLHFSNCIYDYV